MLENNGGIVCILAISTQCTNKSQYQCLNHFRRDPPPIANNGRIGGWIPSLCQEGEEGEEMERRKDL